MPSVFDRNYIEKYIPHTVHLTKLSFQKMVELLWDEMDMNNTIFKLEEVSRIGLWEIRINGIDKWISDSFNLSVENIPNVSVRKVRTFLKELLLFKTDKVNNEEDRKIYIKAIFIRNFLYDIYEKFRLGKKVEEILTFNFEGKECTLQEIIKYCIDGSISKKQLEVVFSDENNIRSYIALGILTYQIGNKVNMMENDNKNQISHKMKICLKMN